MNYHSDIYQMIVRFTDGVSRSSWQFHVFIAADASDREAVLYILRFPF